MSLDGVQLTSIRYYEVTPIILINLNLPPNERYKIENIIASIIIPEPKSLRELDTFLRPLIDELKKLDYSIKLFNVNIRIYFILRA